MRDARPLLVSIDKRGGNLFISFIKTGEGPRDPRGLPRRAAGGAFPAGGPAARSRSQPGAEGRAAGRPRRGPATYGAGPTAHRSGRLAR